MNKLKIENVIFCENIRAELDGKHTLLGASAPELNIMVLPATISVAVWISGTPSAVGPFEADFRILSVDKIELIKGKMNGEFHGTAKTSMVVGPMPLLVDKSGDYSFEWSFGDTKWDNIGVLRIHHVNPSPDVIAFPSVKKQPS